MDKLLHECDNHIEFHQKIIEKMKSMSMMLKTKSSSAQAKVNCMLSTLTKLIKEHENSLDLEINMIAKDMEDKFGRIQQNSTSLLSELNEFKQSVSVGTQEDVDACWSTLDNMIREHHNQEDLNRVASYTYLEFCPNQHYAQFIDLMQNPRLGYIRRFSTQPNHISLEVVDITDKEHQPGQTVTVLLRNRHSEPYLPDELRVNVLLAEKNQNIPCNISTSADRSSGMVTSLTFMPLERGVYTVQVSLYGEKVSNSPLMLSVGSKHWNSGETNNNSIAPAPTAAVGRGATPVSALYGGAGSTPSSSSFHQQLKPNGGQQSMGIRQMGPGMGGGGSFRPRFACAPVAGTTTAPGALTTSSGSRANFRPAAPSQVSGVTTGVRMPGAGGTARSQMPVSNGLDPRLGGQVSGGPVFPTPSAVGTTVNSEIDLAKAEDDFFGLSLNDGPQLADTSVPLPPHIAAALKLKTSVTNSLANPGSINGQHSQRSLDQNGLATGGKYDADGLPIVDKSLGVSSDQPAHSIPPTGAVIDSPIDNIQSTLQDPLMPQVVPLVQPSSIGGGYEQQYSADNGDFVTGVAAGASSSVTQPFSQHSHDNASTKPKSSVSFVDSSPSEMSESNRMGLNQKFAATLSSSISTKISSSTPASSSSSVSPSAPTATSISSLMSVNLQDLMGNNDATTTNSHGLNQQYSNGGERAPGRVGDAPGQSLVNGYARVQGRNGADNFGDGGPTNASLNDSGDWWGSANGSSGSSRPLLEDFLLPNMAGKGIHGEYVGQLGPPAAVFGKPIGCTKNEVTKQLIVCDKMKNNVRFFSEDGKLVSSIARGGDRSFKNPSCALSMEDGRLVLKDDVGMYLFSKDGEFIRTMGIKDRNLQKPFGLAFRNDGAVITLDVPPAYKGGRPSITIFDPNSGKMLEKNLFRALSDAEYKDSKPYFMNSFNDSLIVSDLGHHVIHMVDLNGLPRRRFGGIGDANMPGKFREPSGIAVDGVGYMVIGDAGNHRIQIFNPYGEYVGPMDLSRSIQRPSSIHLTNDGHLLVNNLRRNTVSIFKLQSHTV